MKIVIAGGTGFLGTRLVGSLADQGHALVVLTRNPDRAAGSHTPSVRLVGWDAQSQGPWAGELDGADAVVNLTGETIAGWRWTEQKKRRIRESRVRATTALAEAVRAVRRRPSVFLSMSAVNYYDAFARDAVTESSPPGRSFLSDVTVAWEQAASSVSELGVRLVLLRTGIVLDAAHGALPYFLLPFRLLLGGPLGTGRQWFPWIHPDDVLGIMIAALHRDDLEGPLNVVAPGGLTMREFCTALGRALHRPSWLRVPSPVLRLLLGEMSILVLGGPRVTPRKALEAGYRFRYPTVDAALERILAAPGS